MMFCVDSALREIVAKLFPSVKSSASGLDTFHGSIKIHYGAVDKEKNIAIMQAYDIIILLPSEIKFDMHFL